ncbi:MAG: glycosyltransferase [Anaerolineae bacterium]|nr:glycosyltransferase [Anaerolineae bacterium]
MTKISHSELRGIGLVIIGTLALIFYYSWWFQNGRLMSPWLALGFAGALLYGIAQILLSWIVYLGTHHRPSTWPKRPKGLSVDVFVTACGEEHSMVERNLLACCAMHGKHSTWLLDDGDDPKLAELAKQLGVGYLTREGRKDAKAGNVNAALSQTKGDIIALFDIDHIPAPTYLDKTVGFFADPAVGFVQVMPTFANGGGHGFVAQAATETSFDFYNPTSLGMDGFDSATKMGSNSLIRRAALETIGGYRPGLAEDLATSIALHGAGWRSRYVAEPLAPGLAPPDLVAWFTQQFKWARGVFEVLLTDYLRLFPHLTWGGRIAYAVRTTKYLIGPVIFVHLAVIILILFSGSEAELMTLQGYFYYLTPVALMDVTIRHLALRKWHHSSVTTESLWRAIVIIYASWPIYTFAWVMAVLRLPLSFRPTPKNQAAGISPLWLLPQLITMLLLMGGAFYSMNVIQNSNRYNLLYIITFCLAVPQLGLLRPLLRPRVTSIWNKLMGLNVNISELPKDEANFRGESVTK